MANPATPFPYVGSGTVNAELIQWAATVTFTETDFWDAVTIPVVADPFWVNPAAASRTIAFPLQPHYLVDIRGPLIVVGGTTPGTRSFEPAVMLPGERNAPLFGIRVQPPVATEVDILNIFNDGAQGNSSGVMTAQQPDRLRHGRRPAL